MKFAAKLASISLFFLVSCTSYQADPKIETIVTPPIEQQQVRFSANNQNAGIIDFVEGSGFIIDKGAAERYSTLVALYGSSLVPPVKVGDGLKETSENFILDSEHMIYFMDLSAKHLKEIK